MLKDSGFTLVELMIVVAIAGGLTLVGTLSYLDMRPSLRLNGATRQMLGDLMNARMKSVNENNEYKVFFLNTQQYKILDDDDNDGTDDGGEGSETKNIQDNYPGVTLSATNNPIFSPRGTADAGTTVTLTNEGQTRIITVSLTGRVKIN
jgi:prepilin-type N-terminal cleavage/methylation domain-containing protein